MLVVAVMLIFFVPVLELKSFSQPSIVMAAIPLSLPGAAAGLLVSCSPFGFMAFPGIVSLDLRHRLAQHFSDVGGRV